MVVILGAGLAGLSAAYHLDGHDYLVVERENEVGGLCRSIREDGFTFDYTGHLLHLRDDEIKAWVLELLPDGYRRLDRSAWIHSQDVLTPYPFQANTAGLPVDTRLDCLLGFIETLQAGPARAAPVPDAVPIEPGLPFLKVCPPPEADEPTFLDWIERTFGSGFARHFFVPYNEKLWRRPLSEVTGDWVSWLIPRPDLSDVLRGAITRSEKAFGYNPEFLYPEGGGIDHLPKSLAAHVPDKNLRLSCPVVELEAIAGRVRLADGDVHSSDVILSSMSLPALARMTTDLPADLRAAADQLQHVSIRTVNIGVRGEPVHAGAQWVYFPEPRYPFHRVGLPAALAPAMAPTGHHALVAEVSYLPEHDEDGAATLERCLAGLVDAGFLVDRNAVVYTNVVDIPEAYVVFDAARRRVLPGLLRWYLDQGIVPLGRYGTWDYLAMEDSLVHGREVARWLASRSG